MNEVFKKHVQEPYNEAWNILKIIRDDDSDKAWAEFRKKLDEFEEKRLKTVKPVGSNEYIKGEKEYLENLYAAMLQMGEMSAWILRKDD